MQDYTQAAATPPRQRATLDTIMGQVAGLVDQASGLASDAERIADEMLGATPEVAPRDGRDAGFNGKLDALSKLLDMVAHHQHRARQASRRISGVVLSDDAKQAINDSGLSGTALPGRY